MKRRTGPIAATLRWLRALLFTAKARLLLLRGDRPRAIAALEAAVATRPWAFRPLLRLARAYLLTRDTWRAHRTLAQAREAHPERFARVVPGWLRRQDLDLDVLGQVLAPGVLRPGSGGRVPATAPTRSLSGRPVRPGSLPWGDCTSLDEYTRFRAMPPITAAERASIDWDALLDDLLDD